jgi:hypothetical protein
LRSAAARRIAAQNHSVLLIGMEDFGLDLKDHSSRPQSLEEVIISEKRKFHAAHP